MLGVKEEQGVNKCFHTSCSLGGQGKKNCMDFTQRWAPDVARQDAGTSSVKSKEKGKGKVKVKEDSDGHRQWAWMQMDDGLVNAKREET
jgi:hypothetical protein